MGKRQERDQYIVWGGVDNVLQAKTPARQRGIKIPVVFRFVLEHTIPEHWGEMAWAHDLPLFLTKEWHAKQYFNYSNGVEVISNHKVSALSTLVKNKENFAQIGMLKFRVL